VTRKTLRVVSYSINGRGMGHLVRQLAILRWIRRYTALLDVKCETWVLTSSEADTLARREGVCAFKMPSKAMMRDAGVEPSRYLSVARAWTLNIISGLQPDLLLVDTFPGGSFGELICCLEMAPRRVLVARRVRESIAADPAYASLLPLYHHHIVPDRRGVGPILIREHAELLSREAARSALGIEPGARAVYVTLGGGGDTAAPAALPKLAAAIAARGWRVVVGAGPLYQGPELRGGPITWIDRYVPLELFRAFDAAVSAGGYNAFNELMFCGVPAVFAPQPRVSDDQAERTARAEAAGAGVVAASFDEIPALLDDCGSPDAARSLAPENGAARAAREALAGLIPEADLALAAEVLSPRVLEQISCVARTQSMDRLLEVVRILGGGLPSEIARRQQLLAELADRGVDTGAVAADLEIDDRVDRFLAAVTASGAPLPTAVSLLKALRRKFPAAAGAELATAAVALLGAWARFDDWMGAVSLMRAVPVQRTFRLPAFAEHMIAWLSGADDLFDALREFSRLEAGGKRPVAEVLRLLAHAERPEASP
jgi:hypothetical protein